MVYTDQLVIHTRFESSSLTVLVFDGQESSVRASIDKIAVETINSTSSPADGVWSVVVPVVSKGGKGSINSSDWEVRIEFN